MAATSILWEQWARGVAAEKSVHIGAASPKRPSHPVSAWLGGPRVSDVPPMLARACIASGGISGATGCELETGRRCSEPLGRIHESAMLGWVGRRDADGVCELVLRVEKCHVGPEHEYDPGAGDRTEPNAACA